MGGAVSNFFVAHSPQSLENLLEMQLLFLTYYINIAVRGIFAPTINARRHVASLIKGSPIPFTQQKAGHFFVKAD